MKSAMETPCDGSPLLLFTELLNAALEAGQCFFSFSDLSFELARIESNFSTAPTGEITVHLYPSDTFFRFSTAVFTGDFNL